MIDESEEELDRIERLEQEQPKAALTQYAMLLRANRKIAVDLLLEGPIFPAMGALLAVPVRYQVPRYGWLIQVLVLLATLYPLAFMHVTRQGPEWVQQKYGKWVRVNLLFFEMVFGGLLAVPHLILSFAILLLPIILIVAHVREQSVWELPPILIVSCVAATAVFSVLHLHLPYPRLVSPLRIRRFVEGSRIAFQYLWRRLIRVLGSIALLGLVAYVALKGITVSMIVVSFIVGTLFAISLSGVDRDSVLGDRIRLRCCRILMRLGRIREARSLAAYPSVTPSGAHSPDEREAMEELGDQLSA